MPVWSESDLGKGGQGVVDGNKGWFFLDEVTLQSSRAGLFSFISNEEHVEIMQPKVSFFAWEASWGKVLTSD